MADISELSAPEALRTMLRNLAVHAPGLRLRECTTGLDGTTHLASCQHSPIIIESRVDRVDQLAGARFQNCCVTFLGDLTEGPAARDLVEQVHALVQLDLLATRVTDLHSALRVAPVLTRAARARSGYYCALPAHPALASWWNTVHTQEAELMAELTALAPTLARALDAPEGPDSLVLAHLKLPRGLHAPAADDTYPPRTRALLARLVFLEEAPGSGPETDPEHFLGPRWAVDLLVPFTARADVIDVIDDVALVETIVALHGGDAFPTLSVAAAAARAL